MPAVTIDEPPRTTPKLRLVGIVWAVVGVVALVVGLVTKLGVIAIFGVIALAAGGLVYAAQTYREASAARTRRRMAGGPVSPRTAPRPAPPPARDPARVAQSRGRRSRPWLRGERPPEEAEGDETAAEHVAGDDDQPTQAEHAEETYTEHEPPDQAEADQSSDQEADQEADRESATEQAETTRRHDGWDPGDRRQAAQSPSNELHPDDLYPEKRRSEGADPEYQPPTGRSVTTSEVDDGYGNHPLDGSPVDDDH